MATSCEQSVLQARQAGGLATLAMLLALWLSVMLPFSRYEPLYDVESGDPVCLRSHWTRTHAYSQLWNLKVSVPLGTPTHTPNLLVRLNVAATSALAAQTGLTQVDAEDVVSRARSRASALNGVIVVRGDSLTSSLANPLRDTSTTLTDCVQPHTYAPVTVCSDKAYMFGDPNQSPSPKNRKRPVAVIVVPSAMLSTQAQLLDAHGEFFTHSGLNETASVAVGATTLCTFAEGTLASAKLRGGDAADERTFGASRSATGLLSANAGLQPSRCDSSAANNPVPLFPASTAHVETLMQTTQGTGVADDGAYAAHVCGTARHPSNDSTIVISCAAAPARCAGTPLLPLADAARRPIVLAWDNAGSYTVKTYAKTSDAYSKAGEVQTSITRLLALLIVAVLVERRATHGLSGERILRTATRWASGESVVELVPLGAQADADGETDPEEDFASPTSDMEPLAPFVVLGLRLLQFVLSYEARTANGQGLIIALDAISMAASLLVWGLRVATPCQTRVQALSTMGGSVWLVDSLVTVQNISTHLPLGESLSAHGFSSLARVAMGLVILTHAMPRSVLAVASATVMAKSDKFYDSMTYASHVAAAAWVTILVCTSAIVGSQLIRVVLAASADNFTHFESAAALALVPISAYLISTVLAQLKDPCGDSQSAW